MGAPRRAFRSSSGSWGRLPGCPWGRSWGGPGGGMFLGAPGGVLGESWGGPGRYREGPGVTGKGQGGRPGAQKQGHGGVKFCPRAGLCRRFWGTLGDLWGTSLGPLRTSAGCLQELWWTSSLALPRSPQRSRRGPQESAQRPRRGRSKVAHRSHRGRAKVAHSCVQQCATLCNNMVRHGVFKKGAPTYLHAGLSTTEMCRNVQKCSHCV